MVESRCHLSPHQVILSGIRQRTSAGKGSSCLILLAPSRTNIGRHLRWPIRRVAESKDTSEKVVSTISCISAGHVIRQKFPHAHWSSSVQPPRCPRRKQQLAPTEACKFITLSPEVNIEKAQQGLTKLYPACSRNSSTSSSALAGVRVFQPRRKTIQLPQSASAPTWLPRCRAAWKAIHTHPSLTLQGMWESGTIYLSPSGLGSFLIPECHQRISSKHEVSPLNCRHINPAINVYICTWARF